jgi:Demerecviridae HNH endonuclease
MLTQQRLRELFDYDPVTGRFIRKTGSKTGKLVRKSRGKKPVRVRIDGRTHLAAECAWLWMTDEWPSRRVIHKDGNVKNDCWSNLALRDKVYQDGDRWCARIGRSVVSFDTAEEAYAALRPSTTQRSIQKELAKLGLI